MFPHLVLTVSPHLGPGVVKGLAHRGQSLREQALQGVKLASPSTAALLPWAAAGVGVGVCGAGPRRTLEPGPALASAR